MVTARHLPFLERLQRAPGGSPEWEALALSYRLLGLIDAWADGTPSEEIRGILTGTHFDDCRSTGDTSVTPELAEVRASLLRTKKFPDGCSAVAAALQEWATQLWFEAELDLALDTFCTALEFASHDPILAWQCHRHCGAINRVEGHFERADHHHAACIEIGRSIGADEAVFWGEFGFARVARARGNLPRAQGQYERLVQWAIALGRPDLESRARMELGVTLAYRCRHLESLGQFQVALGTAAASERHRTLANIAFTYVELSMYDTALDAYRRLLAEKPEVYVVLAVHVSLIQIAGALGDRAGVEAHKQFLEDRTLPATVEIDFRMTLGRAYQALGEADAARLYLQQAAALAERSGRGRELIETEAALAKLSHSYQQCPAPPPSHMVPAGEASTLVVRPLAIAPRK